MQIENIFPVPIAYVDVPTRTVENTLALAHKYINDNNWHNKRTYGNTITSYHDDSKRNYIGTVNDNDLGEFLNINAREYIQYCGFNPDTNIRIESWLNLNPPDTHHSLHEHYGCFMGGVLWLTVPEHSGDFAVHDPLGVRVQNTTQYSFAKTEPGPYNTDVYSIYPVEGKMLMFPSWLPHQVRPNQSDQDRISIAFNIWMEQ
jgi:uncharacterized protein (TIGR02466 family)